MQSLIFDTGIEEFEVNSGAVLRFNPGDPNVYSRFLAATGRILALEKEFAAKTEGLQGKLDAQGFPTQGQEAIALLHQLDARVKEELAAVFGTQNNFDAILGGVNVMAITANGERVITNLFTALQPVLEEGAKRHRQDAARSAVQAATTRRNALSGTLHVEDAAAKEPK